MRGVSTAILTAAKSDTGYGDFVAVELDYPSGMVRVNSTMQNIMIEGNEYLGLGVLGSISGIEEKLDGQSVSYTLELNGVPEYLDVGGQKMRAMDYFSAQDVQGRRSRVFIGFTNAKWQVVGVHCINVGFMDSQDISLGVVKITCESRPIDWQRPRVMFLSDVDQRKKYPTDSLFKYVAALPGMTLKWGRA
jgi:hypothetical protein